MSPETAGLHVNPSDETIRLGPLAVRFLLTGDDSTGSVAKRRMENVESVDFPK